MNTFIHKLITTSQQQQVQKLSVGAAIVHEKKLLVLKRRADDFMPNIYELPGGGLEKNESLIDALHREVAEETNCQIDAISGYIGHIDFPSSQGLLTRRFNFLVRPKLPLMIKLSEHDQYQWILPSEAHQHEITPQTRKIIALIQDNKIITIPL